MVIQKTSQIPAASTVQKTSQLPPDPKPTKQYAAGTVGPLEPASHKIARVVMPKTTASVESVGYKETAKRAISSGARQVVSGAATGFSSIRASRNFAMTKPPALTEKPSKLPSWVTSGGLPWQNKRAEVSKKKRTSRKSQTSNKPDWIQY